MSRTPIAKTLRADLPEHIPTLHELWEACGTDFELSLDVKDPAAAIPVIETTHRASAEFGCDLTDSLWLCHPYWETVAGWKQRHPEVHVVDSTRLNRLKDGPERHAARLAEAGIDAINMHHSDWTGGLTTLFHRFDLLCFGWDAQYERVLDETFDLGIDGIYSDHVDRMMRSHQTFFGESLGSSSP